MPYLSVSAVVIHYEEALYQVYALDIGLDICTLPFTV